MATNGRLLEGKVGPMPSRPRALVNLAPSNGKVIAPGFKVKPDRKSFTRLGRNVQFHEKTASLYWSVVLKDGSNRSCGKNMLVLFQLQRPKTDMFDRR